MKKELLIPVGNYETLKYAIKNGADAVYLAGQNFGARKNAKNFTNDELITAIKYCHLYGAKIYVTVNTLIYEKEIDEVVDFIRFLHKSGVDAVIMQDLGLINLISSKFPNLPIHASTQMHNHNNSQIKLLEKMGVKRVVLAREMSIDEINLLKTNIELEAFIHGALCISYSGECLFSSLLLNRSGNRGECAGICRLPFKLMKNDKEVKLKGNYLLSPKEFATFNNFARIMKSNIYSLKVEGRMKSKYYVAFVTKLYRTLIDSYKKNKKIIIKEEDTQKLKVLYNRGFTKGHMFNDKNYDLMNIENPNHQGIEIGEVVEVTNDKIKILLKGNLHQEDGIRFKNSNKGLIINFLYNEKGLLINEAAKGSIVYIDNKINLKNKDVVLKTISYKLEKELRILPNKKILVDINITAKLNQKLIIKISDKTNNLFLEGNVITKAIKNATTKEEITSKLTLGNTPFKLNSLNIDIDDNIFINMSEIKRLKRDVTLKLEEIRKNYKPNIFVEKEVLKKEHSSVTANITINALIKTEEQLLVCLEENIDNVYIDNLSLYLKYQNRDNVFLRISRVSNKYINYYNKKLLVGDLGAINYYKDNNYLVGDYFLNVTNSYTLEKLKELSLERITLSIENKDNNIKDIINVSDKNKLELLVYVKPIAMVMKHCPINHLLGNDRKCNLCSKDKYYLKDRNNKLYNLETDKVTHGTNLYYYKNIDLIENIMEYRKLGIKNFRIDFFDENKDQTKLIISKVRNVKF